MNSLAPNAKELADFKRLRREDCGEEPSDEDTLGMLIDLLHIPRLTLTRDDAAGIVAAPERGGDPASGGRKKL